MIYLITISLAQLFGTFYLIFTKSYLGKKGENQATKEDVGKITEIIEGIKKDLADNTEKLKAELSLQNEHIISLRIFERDSLINYYKSLRGFESYLFRIDPSIYSLENFREISDVRINIDREYYKYDLAEGNVEFFLENELFINQSLKINISLIDFIQFINLSFLELQHHLRSAARILENNQKLEDGRYKQLTETTTALVTKYYHEKLEKYVELRQGVNSMKQTLKQRLTDILNA